jgi:bacitracin transport system ATP-binding protein
MSSHILAEVEHLADRIGIVHAGRLLEELDRDELASRARTFIEVETSDPVTATTLLQAGGFVDVEPESDEPHRLRVYAPAEAAPSIARLLVDGGLELRALTPRREDLEAYFLRTTAGETP